MVAAEHHDYTEGTALLVVDVQNDFSDPSGNLYVQDGEQVVPVINREVDRAQEAGVPVVYTKDWHPPDTPHFAKHGGKWPVHCVRETWGADLHPDLKVVGEIIHKATGPEDGYSGFSVTHLPTGERRETGLEQLLRDRGVDRVVIVGLATDYCVKETGLDAVRKGFGAEVLTEATRPVEVEPGDGGRALDDLEQAGVALV
ncbi:MAG TPA: isochorismatase family protein [Acidimicrobiia bacterium]|nr:isochorismatase family protein [Acidimicrobiia bacterium]